MASTNNLEYRTDTRSSNGKHATNAFWYYVFWISILILITIALIMLIPVFNTLPFLSRGNTSQDSPSPTTTQIPTARDCESSATDSNCRPHVEQSIEQKSTSGIESQHKERATTLHTPTKQQSTRLPSQEYPISPPLQTQKTQDYPLLLEKIVFEFGNGSFERNGTRYRLGYARLRAKYPTDFRKNEDSKPIEVLSAGAPLLQITSIAPNDDSIQIESYTDFFVIEASFDIRLTTLPSFVEIESQNSTDILLNSPVIHFTLASLDTSSINLTNELGVSYRRDIENHLYEFEKTLSTHPPFIAFIHQELARAYVRRGLPSITIPSL